MRRLLLTALTILVCTATAAIAAPEYERTKEGRIAAECEDCHKESSPGIANDWLSSQHAKARVSCYDCHKAESTDSDAQKHEGALIATIVSPKDCSRCHPKEAKQFRESHHSKAATFLSSKTPEGRMVDNLLGYKVEGPAAARTGCEKCHGAAVKVDSNGKLSHEGWPNGGIGRVNPDGSEGSCTACHTRHKFSIGEARKPETSGTCHIGPDHPHIEVYLESKHGVIYSSEKETWDWEIAGKNWDAQYYRAPTCATCHMSGIGKLESTHNVSKRLSWWLAKPRSVKRDNWEDARAEMKMVCMNCHSTNWVENFYKQGDEAVDLYNTKFFDPIKAEMDKLYAEGLLTKENFDEELEFKYFEYWHHEGRRARAGVFMMGPDYTQWHGFYELARNKLELMRLIQELREHKGKH